MKKTGLFIITIYMVLIGYSSYGQMQDHSTMNSIKTETIKVWGNCDLCKARIEKAATMDGVNQALWDKETKMLTLVYDASKVKSDDIQKMVALAGHDTEKYKADDMAYGHLPGCCKYERKR